MAMQQQQQQQQQPPPPQQQQPQPPQQQQPVGSFDDMSLEALREELAAASAQVVRAASTAVDPWDVASGEEDLEEDSEETAAEVAVGGFESGDGRAESSPRDEEQSLDDATPRSIYDETEQMGEEVLRGGVAGGYSNPSVASVLDPVGSLENPGGQIKTLLEFCTPASSLACPHPAEPQTIIRAFNCGWRVRACNLQHQLRRTAALAHKLRRRRTLLPLAILGRVWQQPQRPRPPWMSA